MLRWYPGFHCCEQCYRNYFSSVFPGFYQRVSLEFHTGWELPPEGHFQFDKILPNCLTSFLTNLCSYELETWRLLFPDIIPVIEYHNSLNSNKDVCKITFCYSYIVVPWIPRHYSLLLTLTKFLSFFQNEYFPTLIFHPHLGCHSTLYLFPIHHSPFYPHPTHTDTWRPTKQQLYCICSKSSLKFRKCTLNLICVLNIYFALIFLFNLVFITCWPFSATILLYFSVIQINLEKFN